MIVIVQLLFLTINYLMDTLDSSSFRWRRGDLCDNKTFKLVDDKPVHHKIRVK